jgi:hypothetical protein
MNVTRKMCLGRMISTGQRRALYFSCFDKVPNAIAGGTPLDVTRRRTSNFPIMRIMVPGRQADTWCEEWFHPHYKVRGQPSTSRSDSIWGSYHSPSGTYFPDDQMNVFDMLRKGYP